MNHTERRRGGGLLVVGVGGLSSLLGEVLLGLVFGLTLLQGQGS
ncbi:hypothetical protein [Synechococcus sp. UW105]|nr:hypothetical protein [Synechococcus sp. UW105]